MERILQTAFILQDIRLKYGYYGELNLMDLDKINELVATKIMGWHKHSDSIWDGSSVWADKEDNWHGDVEDFNPSEDIRDAWSVVEKIKEEKWMEIKIEKEAVFCDIGDYSVSSLKEVTYIEANTAPLAICIATLYSIGIEVGEDN